MCKALKKALMFRHFARAPVTHLLLRECMCTCQVPLGGVLVHKGVHSFVDSYSAFYDNGGGGGGTRSGGTKLESSLREKGVTDLFVCGLATDVCVGEDII